MGASQGNQHALGNKGGGRKSAYQEKADAEALFEMFFDEFSKEDIEKKIDAGKYSLKDILISKGLSGDTKILIAIFNKVFPANINIGGQKENPIRHLSDEELDNRIKELRNIPKK